MRYFMALVLAASVVSPFLSPAMASEDAQFRHGADHTGVFADPGPAKLEHQLWVFETGNRLIASPVAADNRVFVGGMNGVFYALDLKTGKERWSFAADAPISATAAISGAVVVFQSNANSIYGVSAADGRLLWRRTMGPTVAWRNFPQLPDQADWDYYASSPMVAGGRVFIGSGDGNIYALNPATGETVWAVKTGSRVRATPASDGTIVYVGSFDGTMYALDAKTGSKRWTFKTVGNSYFPVGEIQSSAAIAGGLVIFGSRDGVMYALDAKTGKPVWKDDHKGNWVIGSPAVADDKVCVGGSDDHVIQCDDLKTGHVLWSVKVDGNVFSSPAVAGGFLYLGSFDGVLHRLALKDGTKTEHYFDERIYSSPWIAGDMAIVTVNDGTVRAWGQ